MRPAPEVPANGAEPAAAAGLGRRAQQVAIVLWPSFLVAAAASVLFFGLFDPEALADAASRPGLVPTRMAGYAIGFFFLWAVAAAASALTLYLAATARGEPPPRVEPWMREIP